MFEFLWSPLPLVISTIAFMMFSARSISRRPWARLGRVVSVVAVLGWMIFMLSGIYEKGSEGARRYEAAKKAGKVK